MHGLTKIHQVSQCFGAQATNVTVRRTHATILTSALDDLIDRSVPNMLQPSEVACTDASARFTTPEGTLDHLENCCLNLSRIVVRPFPSDRCDEHPESYIVILQFIR